MKTTLTIVRCIFVRTEKSAIAKDDYQLIVYQNLAYLYQC